MEMSCMVAKPDDNTLPYRWGQLWFLTLGRSPFKMVNGISLHVCGENPLPSLTCVITERATSRQGIHVLAMCVHPLRRPCHGQGDLEVCVYFYFISCLGFTTVVYFMYSYCWNLAWIASISIISWMCSVDAEIRRYSIQMVCEMLWIYVLMMFFFIGFSILVIKYVYGTLIRVIINSLDLCRQDPTYCMTWPVLALVVISSTKWFELSSRHRAKSMEQNSIKMKLNSNKWK
jgi:hypothetical protein